MDLIQTNVLMSLTKLIDSKGSDKDVESKSNG